MISWRATTTLLLIGSVAACSNAKPPEDSGASTRPTLLRYDDTADVLEVLGGDLTVVETMHVENAELLLPRSIDGAYLLDITEDESTIYDLRTGETRSTDVSPTSPDDFPDRPPGFARFAVRLDTPLTSPWRLVDRFDLAADLLAINAETGEVVSMAQKYSVDGIGRVAPVGGVTFGVLGGPTAQSVVIEINGEELSHRLVNGILIDHRDGVDLVDEQDPGMPPDVDIVLSREGIPIGSPLNVKTDSLFRAAIIDDTSAMILTGDMVFTHDFVTGRDQQMFGWDDGGSIEFLTSNRILVANGSEPGELLDSHGRVIAQLPSNTGTFYYGTECALLSIDDHAATLIRLDTGSVVAEFSVDPQFVEGPAGCTTWGYGSGPVLVLDGAIVDTGGAVVDDVSEDSRYAVLTDSEGPGLLEIATGERTSLPAGEYRFVELGDQ
jgi:hypothetical protein